MYKEYLYEFPKISDNIFDNDNDIQTSKIINFSKIKYGFSTFIHKTKNETEILKDKNKKIYYVVNPFEHTIDKSEEDLYHKIPKYFKDIEIINRAFYKLWEILMKFDLFPKKSKEAFSSAHLAEGPGSFIQATVLFREKFCSINKKDMHYTVTLKGNIPIDKRLDKICNKKLCIHKGDKGDLTEMKTINNFTKDKSVNFITADGGFEWKNENYQEQEAYKLLLGEIITALKIQKEKGSFVLKIFETYTDVTIKLIIILQQFYKEIYIYKPYMSRISNSEKYLVCMNFTKPKNYSKYIKQLEDILVNHKDYLHDIFTNYNISEKIVKFFIEINKELTTKQVVMISNIVSYVKENNYFGEKYNKYKDEQLKATEFWLKEFMKK